MGNRHCLACPPLLLSLEQLTTYLSLITPPLTSFLPQRTSASPKTHSSPSADQYWPVAVGEGEVGGTNYTESSSAPEAVSRQWAGPYLLTPLWPAQLTYWYFFISHKCYTLYHLITSDLKNTIVLLMWSCLREKKGKKTPVGTELPYIDVGIHSDPVSWSHVCQNMKIILPQITYE